MKTSASVWSFTVSTEPRPDGEALIVVCLAPSRLDIGALTDEVAELCGEEEGGRWQHARAEEFGSRLLEALRVHLPTAEVIVHLEDDGPETLRVVVSGHDDADPSRREAELADRVMAIRRRTWLAWSESLELTMAALRRLNEPFDGFARGADTEKAA